jgi:hypothetical protein
MGGNNKQGENYRLQKKQNNGLMNIESRLLQQTPGNKDTVPNKWTKFYEIKTILIGNFN